MMDMAGVTLSSLILKRNRCHSVPGSAEWHLCAPRSEAPPLALGFDVDHKPGGPQT